VRVNISIVRGPGPLGSFWLALDSKYKLFYSVCYQCTFNIWWIRLSYQRFQALVVLLRWIFWRNIKIKFK